MNSTPLNGNVNPVGSNQPRTPSQQGGPSNQPSPVSNAAHSALASSSSSSSSQTGHVNNAQEISSTKVYKLKNEIMRLEARLADLRINITDLEDRIAGKLKTYGAMRSLADTMDLAEKKQEFETLNRELEALQEQLDTKVTDLFDGIKNAASE